MASLQMTKQTQTQSRSPPGGDVNGVTNVTANGNQFNKGGGVTETTEIKWEDGNANMEQDFRTLEEDHIEQMIEELLHYGSIELCSVLPTQTL